MTETTPDPSEDDVYASYFPNLRASALSEDEEHEYAAYYPTSTQEQK